MAIVSTATILGYLGDVPEDVKIKVSNILETMYKKTEDLPIDSWIFVEKRSNLDNLQLEVNKGYYVLNDDVDEDNNGAWGFNGILYKGDRTLVERVNTEVADRQNSDIAIQQNIDAEKARIDAILNMADVDKDTFVELVELINQIDTENDTAFANYVLSNNTALAQEITDRTNADGTLQANIDAEKARITQEITDRTNANLLILYKAIASSNRNKIKDFSEISTGTFTQSSTNGIDEFLILATLNKITVTNYNFNATYKLGFFKYTKSTRVFEFNFYRSINSGAYSIVNSNSFTLPNIVESENPNVFSFTFSAIGGSEIFNITFDLTLVLAKATNTVYFVENTGNYSEGNIKLSKAVALKSATEIQVETNTNSIETEKQRIDDLQYLNNLVPTKGSVNSILSKLDFGFDFSDVLSNSKKFLADFIAKDKDLSILILGDSILGQPNGAPILGDSVARNLPPNANYENWFYYFYNELVVNKPLYHRYDSQTNIFTENGTFSTEIDKFEASNGIPNFSAIKRQSLHRTSTTANASITQNWNLDNFEKMAFIFPKFVAGVQVVTIDVGGAGKVVALDTDGVTKVEAHGYQFTQYIDPAIATDGSGFTQVMDNFHLRLFKVDGATGSINITFSKGNNAETLAYWGSCQWNGNTILLQNLSRPGQPTFMQRRNIKNEISERFADLIICQTMAINDYDQHHSDLDVWLTNLQEYFINDSDGYGRSLQELCTDVEAFDKTALITVMPAWRSSYYDDNLPQLPYNYGTIVPENAWKSIKAFFIKNDLKGIDLSAIFKKAAIEKGLTYEEAFTSSSKESEDSFSYDDTHFNRLGYKITANVLLRIFNNIYYQY